MRKMLILIMLFAMGCSWQQSPASPTLANPTPRASPTEAVMPVTSQAHTDETDTNLDNGSPFSPGESMGEEPFFEANCPIENAGYDYDYGLAKPYRVSFSPDGKNMITVTAKEKLVLVTIGVNEGGSEVIELPLPFPVYQAVWSPAGEQIALAAEVTPGEDQQVFLLNVADMSQMQAVGQPHPVIHYLSWSGDGAYLAYSHSLRYPDDAVTIEEDDGYVVVGESLVSIIDMTTQTTVQEVPIAQRLNMPVGWLADNKTLVISTYRSDGDEGRIYTYNLTSTELKSLTPDNVCDLYPSVSPNGEQIIFTTMSDPTAQTGRFLLGLPDVFIMQADGMNRRRLTDTPGTIEFAPVWSSDGQSIAYSAVNGEEASVFIRDMSESESTAIATFGGYEVEVFAPSWIPVLNQPVVARSVADGDFKIRFSRYDQKSNSFIDLVEFEWYTGELR